MYFVAQCQWQAQAMRRVDTAAIAIYRKWYERIIEPGAFVIQQQDRVLESVTKRVM